MEIACFLIIGTVLSIATANALWGDFRFNRRLKRGLCIGCGKCPGFPRTSIFSLLCTSCLWKE
jgi:hypothetical protein